MYSLDIGMQFFSHNYEWVSDSTVKPVNKGHQRERLHNSLDFIDMWSLFGGYFLLFNQGRVTEVWPVNK